MKFHTITCTATYDDVRNRWLCDRRAANKPVACASLGEYREIAIEWNLTSLPRQLELIRARRCGSLGTRARFAVLLLNQQCHWRCAFMIFFLFFSRCRAGVFALWQGLEVVKEKWNSGAWDTCELGYAIVPCTTAQPSSFGQKRTYARLWLISFIPKRSFAIDTAGRRQH